ncbi:hypothetical protein ACIBSW_40230 [Actinoplanes sp. NPDC049668]|uniref:hypothetical protein n=1 Tax=unclassified Actinoplanes TaxID=2626549 RepID=UPI0033B06A1F
MADPKRSIGFVASGTEPGGVAREPGDITGLLEARSASVALAVTGDSTHLHDFVDCDICCSGSTPCHLTCD